MSWGRPSGRSGSCSSARCRRRGARRSCAAPYAPGRWGRTRAISRRSRIRRRWRRSHVRSERLEGVALVTGGGRGIGADVARELAAAGMQVAVTARTADEVEAVASEIGGQAALGGGAKREGGGRVVSGCRGVAPPV